MVMAVLALIAGFFRVVPLFHLAPLRQMQKQVAQAGFNATNYATTFWNEKLLKSLNRAADARQVLTALAADPPKARTQYGRKVGVSSTTLFFLRGTGQIIGVKKNSLELALNEGDATTDISLPTGLLFGNAVRDGTGLLDVSEFPNSQDFNDLSTQLNHIVETTLLPKLREEVKAGVKIWFAGCAEIDDEDTDVRPLKVIPVSVKIEPTE